VSRIQCGLDSLLEIMLETGITHGFMVARTALTKTNYPSGFVRDHDVCFGTANICSKEK
jgi:hypothetical protein